MVITDLQYPAQQAGQSHVEHIASCPVRGRALEIQHIFDDEMEGIVVGDVVISVRPR